MCWVLMDVGCCWPSGCGERIHVAMLITPDMLSIRTLLSLGATLSMLAILQLMMTMRMTRSVLMMIC